MSSLPTLNRKIKTIVSPFHELLCSLHVFYQPEHHPKRLQWALDLNKAMPLTLQENILTLGESSDGWIPLLDLPDRVGAPISCNQGIIMLSNLPDAELVYLLMNQRVTLSTIVEALRGSASSNSGAEINTSMQNLIENLRSIRKLLIETLVIYEQNYFRQEWGCHIPTTSCGIPGQVYNDGPPSDLLRQLKAFYKLSIKTTASSPAEYKTAEKMNVFRNEVIIS
jgi:hypothetical protein